MRLSELVKGVEYEVIGEGNIDEIEISSLCTDSREGVSGSLFFCLTGGARDAHEYAWQALTQGAAAFVVERSLPMIDRTQILVKDTRLVLGLLAARFYGDPSKRMRVVGITGTNGKTTTAHMLAEIAKEGGKKAGVIGTLGVSFEGKSYPSELTTPDPIPLHRVLSEMEAAGVEYVFMEVSAHALYYKKTAGVRFAACIFTNLTQDHLDFFPSMTAYGEAKAGLFTGEICPIAVLNGDDPWGRKIGCKRRDIGVKTTYYGIDTPADAFAISLSESKCGSDCMFNFSDKLCRVQLSMVGSHNVYNALSAGACALELGFSLKTVARGLVRFKGVTGRLQRVATYRGGDIFIDFAHTPDGLEKSLRSLRTHCEGELICLFGCGGNRDKSKRAIMGEVSAKACDFSVLTSDNPRFEDPMDILSEIAKGHRRRSSRYVIIPDRRKAIAYALDRLKEGDILLVAGKGGEEYQEIMGIKYPYNDHSTVMQLLEKRGEK